VKNPPIFVFTQDFNPEEAGSQGPARRLQQDAAIHLFEQSGKKIATDWSLL
jgi:hypothetical protein